MKKKWAKLLIGVGILVLTLGLTYRPGTAAPSGEIKIACPTLGTEVPIHYRGGATDWDWMKMLYDPLVGTTPDSQESTEHGLARKWEMTPDGLTWTFYLRKGVKFHNGEEVTAKDVKFSLALAVRPNSMLGYAGQFKATIASVDVKDPYTIVIRCKKPYPYLANLLADVGGPDSSILPKDYFEKVGPDEFAKRPIGSGPYKWHSQMIGSYIKLEATDKHWRDGVPRYKYVTFLLIPEEISRISMLKTGEADITFISRENVAGALKAGLNVVSKEDTAVAVLHCTMQWADPAFADVRFRKALNISIDREAIIKHLFAGMAKPVDCYLGKDILTCGGDPSLKPYPYSPEEAKKLIKEGGYDGYKFKIASYSRSGLPEYSKLVEVAAGYWQKIGLKPEIVMTDYDAFRKRWESKKSENWVCGFDSASSPGCSEVISRLWKKFHSSENRSVTNLPEIDAMLDKASTSLNPNEVPGIIKKFHQFEYNNYLTIPICNINEDMATTKRIPKWDPGNRRRDRNFIDIIKQ